MGYYLLYDTATGAQIGAMTAEAPEPGEGEAVAIVPHSFFEGLVEWSPAHRGFVDTAPAIPSPTVAPTAAELAAWGLAGG